MKNEEIIKKYCIQIRRPFCLSEISENTGIDKSICHGFIQQFLQSGLIERVCGSERPKYYRWIMQKSKPICRPSAEVLEKVSRYVGSEKSHNQISEELGLSRSSVSMAVKALKDTGNEILISPNRLKAQLNKKQKVLLKQSLLLQAEEMGIRISLHNKTIAEIKMQIKWRECELLKRSNV